MRFNLATILLLASAVLFSACQSATPLPPTHTFPPPPPSLTPSPSSTWTLTPTETLPEPSATLDPTATFTWTPLPPAALTATAQPVEGAASPPPQNIILIMVDSLRSDHVSSYGYSRNTTPYLDAFVTSAGVRFEHVISTSPWTCPSVAAMFTGRTPTSLNSTFKTMNYALPRSAKTLAEYLREVGYYTTGYASTFCVQSKRGFSQGFDHYDDTLSTRPSNNKALASEVNERAMKWLQEQYLPKIKEKKPLFLFLYYFDPHVWYDPPPPYDMLYDPEYTGPLTPEVYGVAQDVVEGRIVPTERDIEHVQALYDGEVSYWDAQLGQMLIFLQENHLLDNALIIVTSDHGEMFGEHGKWMHGNSLYQEVLRVPLVMRYTGVIPAGEVVTAPVQNFDLFPTILEWVGLPIPEELGSISLRDISLGVPRDEGRPLYSEIDAINDPSHPLNWNAPKVSLHSIQEGEWKLIHHLGNPADDELYQLAPSSIYEGQNTLADHPDISQHLLDLLVNWFGLNP